MIFREAQITDIPQMQIVRNSVKENVLSDPALVPDHDVEDFIIRRGKGWVCEIDSRIVGFAIADLEDHNIWALFIQPEFAEKGIIGLLVIIYKLSKTKKQVPFEHHQRFTRKKSIVISRFMPAWACAHRFPLETIVGRPQWICTRFCFVNNYFLP